MAGEWNLLSQRSRKVGECEMAQRVVRPVEIVVHPVLFRQHLRLRNAREDLPVQEFVT